MKARRVVTEYFSFNRAEQRGVSILLLLLLTLVLLKRFLPDPLAAPPAGGAAFERDVAAFAAEVARAEEAARQKRMKPAYTARTGIAYRTDTNHAFQRTTRPQLMIELNAADTMELQRLRGIGSGFARRITGYRNKLGGFANKVQLLEVYGMDASRYAMIRDYVTANADSVRKIDINNVTFKALMAHPYFPYEITREVILYRKKNKRFNSAEELMQVPGISDSLYRKIAPYVRVD